jgi:hypothetical protein
VPKMLLKGRRLLDLLHGACVLLLGGVRENPTRFETGRVAHEHADPRGMVGTDSLTVSSPLGSTKCTQKARPAGPGGLLRVGLLPVQGFAFFGVSPISFELCPSTLSCRRA